MQEITLIRPEHFAEVHTIEELCFSEPWSERSLGLLCEGENFGIAALVDGRVAAYGGMTCVLDEGSVTNIATHPDFRRRGLASAVLSAMLCEAEKRGIENIFLEVRASNDAARDMYLKAGFCELGVRRGFYRHPTEDAIQMAYRKN
ncbi:MAG: ribosomal protein S18-alanine N-acetyltransferase [Clostridia bacterium]|nr:ribosomal protein S18-alanine N-acetyltransferase [Clostridia bacterium]